MQLTIPVKDHERFYLLIELLSVMRPFNKLNKREKQVLSYLYYQNYQLKNLDEKKRNRLIFDFDTRREISLKYGISHDSVYNIMCTLRKKELLLKNGFNEKYIVPYSEFLTINFSKNDN